MNRDVHRRKLTALVSVILLGGCGREGHGRAEGDQPAASPAAAAASAVVSGRDGEQTPNLDGSRVYQEHCAVCHMADGRGVPNMQPPIVGSPYVVGDEQKLANVIRGGSAVLAADRPNPVANDMPPFGYLSNEEVDALVDYVRSAFGD